MYKECFFKAH